MPDHLNNALAAVVAIAAALAALSYLVKKARSLFRVLDRMEALVGKELTNNGGSSMKDSVEKALGHVEDLARDNARRDRSIERVGERIEVVYEIAKATRDEQRHHGEQSRAAMAIYRKALADQGVHLPVAPGEDGYGSDD